MVLYRFALRYCNVTFNDLNSDVGHHSRLLNDYCSLVDNVSKMGRCNALKIFSLNRGTVKITFRWTLLLDENSPRCDSLEVTCGFYVPLLTDKG